MPTLTKTKYGEIQVSRSVIASVVGESVLECYGVVGFAPKSSIGHAVNSVLRKGIYENAVFVDKEKGGLSIDLYLIIAFGVKVTEVLSGVQSKVKYVVEKQFGVKVIAVNAYAMDLKKVD